jgi:hypothetical protein
MLGYSGVQGSLPFVIKYTFDHVQGDARRGAPVRRPAVAAFGVLQGLLSFGAGYFSDCGLTRHHRPAKPVTARHADADLAFFNRQRAGQIVSRVTPT